MCFKYFKFRWAEKWSNIFGGTSLQLASVHLNFKYFELTNYSFKILLLYVDVGTPKHFLIFYDKWQLQKVKLKKNRLKIDHFLKCRFSNY